MSVFGPTSYSVYACQGHEFIDMAPDVIGDIMMHEQGVMNKQRARTSDQQETINNKASRCNKQA